MTNDILEIVKTLINDEIVRENRERNAPIDHSIPPDIREANELYGYGRLRCAEDLLDEIKELQQDLKSLDKKCYVNGGIIK